MRHVNYKQWARYLSRAFGKAGIPVERVLDVSCGTGKLAVELVGLGYRMAAFDGAFEMVVQARENVMRKLPVWHASMLNFRLREQFDAVISTYDSYNYSLERADCARFLDCAADSLKSGGLLVFDVCTERNSKRYFSDYVEKGGVPEISYQRRSSFSEREKIQTNEFLIKWRYRAEWYKEIHLQRIYKLAEITDLISDFPFQTVGVYEGFTFRPGSEKSDRVHFVLSRT
jgi:SAM-dependent methyltransferase